MDISRVGCLQLCSASSLTLALVGSENIKESLLSIEIGQKRVTKCSSPLLKLSQFSTLIASFEEDDLACLMMEFDLQRKDVLGIEYGPWYIKPRSLHWWELYRVEVMEHDHGRFQKMFRVSVRTFNYLYDLIGNDMQRNPPPSLGQGIHCRKLEVDKQIAISLHRLATGDTVFSISELFGVSPATVSRTLKRFIMAMLLRGKHHLQWPSTDDLQMVKRKFENLWGIPQVCGAIDCTRVEFDLPSNARSKDFYDKDHDYSCSTSHRQLGYAILGCVCRISRCGT